MIMNTIILVIIGIFMMFSGCIIIDKTEEALYGKAAFVISAIMAILMVIIFGGLLIRITTILY